ncbi:MAG: formylglycine-generating enzyme family protein, partial [Kiritimatiellia bacterium]
ARASAARRKRLKILVVIATFVLFLAITDYLHLFVIPRRQFVSACADIRKSCANGNVLDACEHFEKIQTWRGQDKMLLATVSNEVAQAKTREIATRLEAARSAEASAQWQVCLDQAVAVLAITPDQAEAMALKQEAEGHLAPTLTINATAGGIAVSATISDGTKTWTTPATLKLVPDQVYNFTVFIFTYGGSGGPALPRQYKSAAISLTADWRGAKTQTVTLEEQKGPAEAQLWTIYDLAMTFMPVASGDFQMGSESGDSDEKPVHRVKISRAFWMGKTEVTQKQWQTLMGDNPSKFKGADQPVEQVDWDKCVTFCQKLTQRERAAGRIPAGYEFRLPTEAEWEYAARGGVESRAFAYSGSASLDDVAWSKANSGSKTQPVGQKKPNELGLYDMSGNVWEWCFDLYGNYNTIAVSDPKGSSLGSNRVGRGGGWCNDAPSCRSTFRVWYKPSLVYDGLGFRVVLAPVP